MMIMNIKPSGTKQCQTKSVNKKHKWTARRKPPCIIDSINNTFEPGLLFSCWLCNTVMTSFTVKDDFFCTAFLLTRLWILLLNSNRSESLPTLLIRVAKWLYHISQISFFQHSSRLINYQTHSFDDVSNKISDWCRYGKRKYDGTGFSYWLYDRIYFHLFSVPRLKRLGLYVLDPLRRSSSVYFFQNFNKCSVLVYCLNRTVPKFLRSSFHDASSSKSFCFSSSKCCFNSSAWRLISLSTWPTYSSNFFCCCFLSAV